MRIAKVIVLAISAPKNKIYRLHDQVNENMFPKGRFDELLKGGYIQLTEENQDPIVPVDGTEAVVSTKEQDEIIQGEVEATFVKSVMDGLESELAVNEGEDEKKEPAIGDTTRVEIMELLDKEGIEFGKNESKEELYKKYRSRKKRN